MFEKYPLLADVFPSPVRIISFLGLGIAMVLAVPLSALLGAVAFGMYEMTNTQMIIVFGGGFAVVSLIAFVSFVLGVGSVLMSAYSRNNA